MFGMSTTSPMMPTFGATEPRQREGGEPAMRVCVLGSRESGKTCFLGGIGLLDKLAGWNVRADGRSMTRLDQIVTALSAVGSWLPGTQDTERYILTVSHGRDVVSFDVFDYPGQNFHQVIRACNRELGADLLQHFLDSNYLLLLVDPADDPANTTNRTALIDAVKHRFLGSPSAKRPQVAIVLTKADEVRDAVKDPATAAAFVNERYPEFLCKLQSIVGKVNVFPVSAVGGVDENGRPLTGAEPTGYEPLFKWMTAKQTIRQPRAATSWSRWPAMLGAAVAISFLAWLVPDFLAYRASTGTLNDQTASAMDRLDRTRDYHGWFNRQVNSERERVAREELDRLEGAVKETTEAAPLRRIADDARSAKSRVPAGVLTGFVACTNQAMSKAGNLTFESLQKMKDAGNSQWIERAQLFLDRYPDDAKAALVCDWFASGRSDQHKAARKQLAEIEVDDPASCHFKAEAINRFLVEWGKSETPRERQRLTRAAEIAQMFSRKRDWEVHFVSTGEFRNARGMALRVYNPENDFVGVDFDGSRRVTNSEEVRSMEWRPGQTLRVQLWGNDSMLPFNRADSLAATLSLDNPFAIVSLLDPNEGYLELKADQRWRDQFISAPYARFRVGGLQPEDVRIVKEYLYPGARWQ
jgi:hypothetical protein